MASACSRSIAGRSAGGAVGPASSHEPRTGTTHHATLLPPPPAADLLPRTPGRPNRDPVQPVAQQVGVANRARPASQDKKDSLKGILGMLCVAQKLPANTHDHRPMSRHQRGESGLASRFTPSGGVSLQELPVRKPGHRAALEERLDLPDYRP